MVIGRRVRVIRSAELCLRNRRQWHVPVLRGSGGRAGVLVGSGHGRQGMSTIWFPQLSAVVDGQGWRLGGWLAMSGWGLGAVRPGHRGGCPRMAGRARRRVVGRQTLEERPYALQDGVYRHVHIEVGRF